MAYYSLGSNSGYSLGSSLGSSPGYCPPTPQPQAAVRGNPFSGCLSNQSVPTGQLCEIPPAYVSVQGLLCIKGNINANTVGGLSLCKFYRKEVTTSDGQVYSQLQEPKWPLKITLDEAEVLKVKLDYMIRQAKEMNENPSGCVDCVALADATRQSYQSDMELKEAADDVEKQLMMSQGSNDDLVHERYQFGGGFGAIGSSQQHG